MRTKTLLLSAAALAAGVLASQAQSNVYSANIVGYVTTVFQPSGQYTLVANPFDDGNGNTITDLVDAVLPNKSSVLYWDPVGQTYVTATKGGGVWNTNIALPPGTGFFVKTPGSQAAPITNTFVGTIIAPANGSSNVVVNLPAALYLAGNGIPFSGNINDYQTSGTNTVNIGGVLPNKSTLLIWDPVGQAYVTATKGGGTWNTNVALNPGQGYFIDAHSATNWPETLLLQ